MQYMVTFTINIPQMLAYIPYMDPMGNYDITDKNEYMERVDTKQQPTFTTFTGDFSSLT